MSSLSTPAPPITAASVGSSCTWSRLPRTQGCSVERGLKWASQAILPYYSMSEWKVDDFIIKVLVLMVYLWICMPYVDKAFLNMLYEGNMWRLEYLESFSKPWKYTLHAYLRLKMKQKYYLHGIVHAKDKVIVPAHLTNGRLEGREHISLVHTPLWSHLAATSSGFCGGRGLVFHR